MACNCGKRKKPTGSGKKPLQESRATSTRMGSNRTQTFTLLKPNGEKTVYGSKLEALADQVRYGGTIQY